MNPTRTALVADDSQTVQRVVEMACVGAGVDVVTADDGDAAIARISDRPPDIVLVDIAMPGRNGYEVAAFVKGRSDLAHIPVLLLAGMFEPADAARASALGCAEVLVKPLKPQHVMSRVQHWLGADAAHQAPMPAEASGSGASSTDDYFNRLDAAFKSLQPPAPKTPSPSGEVGQTESAPVPTLQELLERLPEETRSRLTPASPEGTQTSPDIATLDALATILIERLASRDDLLRTIAHHLARSSRQ